MPQTALHFALCLTAACLPWLAGCALFDSFTVTDFKPALREDGSSELPSIVPTRDAVTLELTIIERRADDPLLGKPLWEDLDQIGTFSPETRLRLAENGFRVGYAGPTPPRALQSLLGLTEEFVDPHRPDESSRGVLIRRLTIPADMESEIYVGGPYAKCEARIRGTNGGSDRSYDDARCLLRVKARRLQDGWAEVELVPEVKHGSVAMRHVVDGSQWQFQNGQQRDTLFSQKFTLRLNKGETTVITAEPDEPDSLGHRFFRGPVETAPKQRLLVIRLADLNTVKPVYAE
jgi:hypothetical protein